jgi:hypothetical protein
MRKKIAATAMGAVLLAGGGLGAALLAPTTATAASSSSTSASSASAKADGQRGAWMTAALKKLVNAGTITQAQADAVAKALESARPQGGPGHGGHPGLAAAATAIGVSEADLHTAMQSGKTIADVARAKGVDVTTVIDAIVTDMNSHLADAVSNGKLTQAQADEMKSKAGERATDLVNGTLPARGDGGPGGPGRPGGPGGPGGPRPSDTSSSSGSTS